MTLKSHYQLLIVNCQFFPWECRATTKLQLSAEVPWFELEVVSLENEAP